MALCVIYDTTQETQEKLELARRDAAIRSLADEYKSIMYINIDDDSIKFYREDTTLEEWKDEVGKHSELMNIFAERFVHEDNLAEYKYMQSLNVFLYNSLHSAGVGKPINIAINFVINAALSLFLTWVSAKTITPLTNFTCNKVSALLWKQSK